MGYAKYIASKGSEVYGIIGDPIDHSLSPLIQNVAFQSAVINAVYVPFHVKKHLLRSAVDGIRALDIRGFNVTAPHKMKVIQYLDQLDNLASEIGSVNTVLNRGGLLKGFNTDAMGALMTLEEAGAKLDGRSVLLIGAGGACQALAYTFAPRAQSIQVINRTLAKARHLRGRLRKKLKVDIQVAQLSSRSIKVFLDRADIVVNASSMGQRGYPDVPVQRDCFHQDQFVMDLVYEPLETKLLKLAQASGATVIDGLHMLVNQGACAFKIWTGKIAPVSEMREALLQRVAVQENACG